MNETNESLTQARDQHNQQIAKLKRQLQHQEAHIASLHRHILELEKRLAEAERRLLRRSAILTEDPHIRQVEGETKRRWFSDSYFDLIVWWESHSASVTLPDSFVTRAEQPQPGMVRKLRSLYGAKPPERNETHIIGFQLCFDKTGSERALTWQEASGYSHYRVDTGEDGATSKRTPLLVTDTDFAPLPLAEQFKRHSAEIDQQLARFVYEKIIQYHV